jgi:hypothetical protein
MNRRQCPKDESQWARLKYHARWPAKQLAHRVDSQFLFQWTIDLTIGLPEVQIKEDAAIVTIARDRRVYFRIYRTTCNDLARAIQEAVRHGAERKVYVKADARANPPDGNRQRRVFDRSLGNATKHAFRWQDHSPIDCELELPRSVETTSPTS